MKNCLTLTLALPTCQLLLRGAYRSQAAGLGFGQARGGTYMTTPTMQVRSGHSPLKLSLFVERCSRTAIELEWQVSYLKEQLLINCMRPLRFDDSNRRYSFYRTSLQNEASLLFALLKIMQLAASLIPSPCCHGIR
jgi:hypothetical protein